MNEPWECPRCGTMNAAYMPQCTCKKQTNCPDCGVIPDASGRHTCLRNSPGWSTSDAATLFMDKTDRWDEMSPDLAFAKSAHVPVCKMCACVLHPDNFESATCLDCQGAA